MKASTYGVQDMRGTRTPLPGRRQASCQKCEPFFLVVPLLYILLTDVDNSLQPIRPCIQISHQRGDRICSLDLKNSTSVSKISRKENKWTSLPQANWAGFAGGQPCSEREQMELADRRSSVCLTICIFKKFNLQ